MIAALQRTFWVSCIPARSISLHTLRPTCFCILVLEHALLPDFYTLRTCWISAHKHLQFQCNQGRHRAMGVDHGYHTPTTHRYFSLRTSQLLNTKNILQTFQRQDTCNTMTLTHTPHKRQTKTLFGQSRQKPKLNIMIVTRSMQRTLEIRYEPRCHCTNRKQ